MQVWILEIVTHDEHDYTDREDVYSSKEAAWPDFEALLRDRSDSDADFRFALEGAKEGEDGSVAASTPGSWQEIRLVPVDVLTEAKTRQDTGSPGAPAEAAAGIQGGQGR
jgi:hypothetical protein